MSKAFLEGRKERFNFFFFSWIFQAMDVPALPMPSCKSGATSSFLHASVDRFADVRIPHGEDSLRKPWTLRLEMTKLENYQ